MARRKNDNNRVDPSAFDQAGARVIDNPLKADETFDHLLGKDASHRYREIMNNADKVAAEEIDV